MSSSPNIEERYPSYIDRPYILQQFKSQQNTSRHALLSDYSSGYGNLTGFHLSYKDTLEGRNASEWPFPEKKGPFIEDENFSILPNLVSRRAANVWNAEGKCVDLPSSRDDDKEEKNGVKLNSGDFPLNISGLVRGKFNRINTGKDSLTPIHMPLPQYLAKLYQYRTDERRSKEDEKRNLHNGDDDDNYSTPIDVDLQNNEYMKKIGNFTEPEGSIKLAFYNTYPQNTDGNLDITDTTTVQVSMRLNDLMDKDEHMLSLSGIYHQDTGNMVVTTRSAKFDGIYALPELNLAPGFHFNKSRWALYEELNKTKIDDLEFQQIERLVDASDECEYIGYFHIESTNLTKEELKQIDYELINPIGRPHRPVPELKLSSGVLYSPNCAILFDLGEAEGLRDEISDNTLRNTILAVSLVVLLQIWILIRQMAQTNTPSTLSKLSFWTISIINMADGSISVISLLCSMIYNELYIQFAVCSFLAFTCSAIYEMKYGIQIYCTQLNERPLDWRTMLQGTPVDERSERRDQNLNNTNDNTNNANTTTTDNATNTFNFVTPANPAGTTDEQAVGAELYTRHFFTMLVFLFVLMNVVTWPRTPRRVFEYIFITFFNSFWFPQIYRNVLRGSRTSFSWEFILYTSVLRLIPVVYIDLFPNSFHHHRDIGYLVFLFFWMSLQLVILLLQELLGPRFFLSDKYLPATYDYHPIITKGDIESGFNLDAEELVSDGSSSTDEDSRNLKYVTDCAICMQKVEIPVLDTGCADSQHTNSHNENHGEHGGLLTSSLLPSSSSIGFGKGTANLIARRKYMVTPCKHVFHTECLENWMMYKLQCPVCRNSLPPF